MVAQKQEFCSFWDGMIRDRQLVNQAGQWCFPGGKVEPGENAITAALREFQQETGIETGGWAPRCSIAFDYKSDTNNVVFSLVHCTIPSSQTISVTGINRLIEKNISGSQGRPTGALVTDWELQRTIMVPRKILPNILGVRVAVGDEAKRAIAKLRPNDHSQAIDWYGWMAEALNKNAPQS
nr:NUDIX domain-containing protein [Methylobacterium platani]